jgi:hypothetical protein
MAQAGKPRDKAELEQELRDCGARGDHLGALDVYEELDKAGWITPGHLVGMGVCLMKVRRRQDAKDAWMRAVQIDEKFPAAAEALDKNFPGWRKELRPKPPPPTPKPPPPRPAAAPARPIGPAREPTPDDLMSATFVNWDFVLNDLRVAKAQEETREDAPVET